LTTKYDPSPYWRVVEDSLVEIHGLPRGEARNLVSEYRANLRALPPDIDQDIIYHLVDRNLPHDAYGEQYRRILERHAPLLRLRPLAISTPA
jgi:hypothetical protein